MIDLSLDGSGFKPKKKRVYKNARIDKDGNPLPPKGRKKDGSPKKRRADRAYIIYRIDRVHEGVIADVYIGLVGQDGRAVSRAIAKRFHQHITRALGIARGYEGQKTQWKLHQSIREHGKESFRISLVERVIGKAAAHVRETELMHKLGATLNTHMRKKA